MIILQSEFIKCVDRLSQGLGGKIHKYCVLTSQCSPFEDKEHSEETGFIDNVLKVISIVYMNNNKLRYLR
jgi:hypothetical protein